MPRRVAGVTTIDDLYALAEASNPVVRARQLGQALSELGEVTRFLAAQRRQTIAQLRERGMSPAEIAAALSRTPGRVSQLLHPGRRMDAAAAARRSEATKQDQAGPPLAPAVPHPPAG